MEPRPCLVLILPSPWTHSTVPHWANALWLGLGPDWLRQSRLLWTGQGAGLGGRRLRLEGPPGRATCSSGACWKERVESVFLQGWVGGACQGSWGWERPQAATSALRPLALRTREPGTERSHPCSEHIRRGQMSPVPSGTVPLSATPHEEATCAKEAACNSSSRLRLRSAFVQPRGGVPQVALGQ